MTVIVFDGRTLAADKQATYGSLRRSVTKVHRVDGLLVGLAGDSWLCAEMLDWIRTGRHRDAFPDAQRSENFATVVVIDEGKTLVYERSPVPVLLEDPVYATGSGRDFALAALMCGCDARRAVAVACALDVSCGMGIDAIDLYPEEPDAA